jgi:hypothetical protein
VTNNAISLTTKKIDIKTQELKSILATLSVPEVQGT